MSVRINVFQCIAGLSLLCALEGKTMAEMKSNAKELVHVSSSEAKKKGLPAIDIQLYVGSGGLSVSKFAQPDNYLVVSGAPGGIYVMQIDAAHEDLSESNHLAKKLTASLGSNLNFKLPPVESIQLAGIASISQVFSIADPTFHNIVGCLIFVPNPKNRQQGLLVMLERSGVAAARSSDILKLFEPMVSTLKLGF